MNNNIVMNMMMMGLGLSGGFTKELIITLVLRPVGIRRPSHGNGLDVAGLFSQTIPPNWEKVPPLRSPPSSGREHTVVQYLRTMPMTYSHL